MQDAINEILAIAGLDNKPQEKLIMYPVTKIGELRARKEAAAAKREAIKQRLDSDVARERAENMQRQQAAADRARKRWLYDVQAAELAKLHRAYTLAKATLDAMVKPEPEDEPIQPVPAATPAPKKAEKRRTTDDGYLITD